MSEETTETRAAEDGADPPTKSSESDTRGPGDGADSAVNGESMGIYTGEEIPPALRERSPAGATPGRTSAAYAQVCGIERGTDGIELTVELFDGSTETMRLDAPSDARLEGRLRALFHYLGLEEQDATALQGELVPIVETDDGVELDDLGIDVPSSNRRESDRGPSSLSGILGRVQRLDPTLGFLEALLASSVGISLFLLLFVAGTGAKLGLDTGAIFGTIVAQLLAAVVLVVRSSVLDPK